MITTLTKEQEELIEVYKKKWHDIFFSLEFDQEKAFRFVDFLYSLIDKKPPVKIVLDSPLAVQLAANILASEKKSLSSQLWAQLWARLSSQLWSRLNSQLSLQLGTQLRSQLGTQLRSQLRSQSDLQFGTQLRLQLRSQLGSQLFSQLESQLLSQLWSQLHSQLELQLESQLYSQLKVQHLKFFSFDYWGDTTDYPALCFYEYINKVLLPKVNIPIFNKYLKLSGANINFLLTFENVAFISKPPVFINFDDDDCLHFESGAAVEYADGYKVFFLHGVPIDEELFNKVKDDTITSEEILAIENAEVKAAILQTIGFQKVIDNLKNKKVVDEQVRPFNKDKNKPVTYTLFETDEFPIRLLKVEWYEHNRKRQTVLGVPRTIDDAIEAVAWTCYTTKEEWEKELLVEA